MNEFVKSKIEELRADFTQITGGPFKHFFCPILFRDEDTPLSQAHIINEAFNDSARACTVQRTDVDSFYGSRFESDFIDIQEFKDATPIDVIADRALSRKFSSKILLDDEPVDFFHSKKEIPKQFTRVKLEDRELEVPFGLKMHPADVIAAERRRWEIEISRDVRVPMLVSTIKAAHLTLFELLGYSYALSASGHFVGRQILGEFFLQNFDKPKHEVQKNALPFFREFVNMVRPMISCSFDSKGTITDKTFYMCVGSSGHAWAMIVFIKTAHIIHSVLLPVFERPEQAATFLNFLQNSNESVQVAVCEFKQDRWEITKNTMPLVWPKSSTDYPR